MWLEVGSTGTHADRPTHRISGIDLAARVEALLAVLPVTESVDTERSEPTQLAKACGRLP
jgi:hypothetical protein